MNHHQTTQTIHLIRRPEVLTLTARSKSALQLDEKAGLFIPPVSIGQRAVAYLKHEVEAIIQARIEEQTPTQIRHLVSELIKQRKKIVK